MVHEPAHQTGTFQSKSRRFSTRESDNTESELNREVTMDDFKEWNRSRKTIPPKDRVDTAVTCNSIGSKGLQTQGADKIYDVEPDLESRIKRMPGMRMAYKQHTKASTASARFPDNIVKTRYVRESKPMGPASYKIQSKGTLARDKSKGSSSFKSTSSRFPTKRTPFIDLYNHGRVTSAWASQSGGHFQTSHGLQRFK